MATERYQYAAWDGEQLAVMPEPWAQAVAFVVPGCSVVRRIERTDGAQVSHGEWHPVEGGGR